MKLAVVIPNWNGEAFLSDAIDSILRQSVQNTLIVVDNNSTDSSRQILESYGNKIVTIYLDKNYGFTGGVIPGMQFAIDNNYDGVALFNNDATADKNWLKELVLTLKKHPEAGIATCLLLTHDRKHIDSTGDTMTTWGLPYPRSRKKSVKKYAISEEEYIFGATGGATLYRTLMLRDIGLMDDNFFAYYEDIDISFRAQLAGWRVMINPASVAYHRISKTSERMPGGFTVYQTFKNMPMVLLKNVPSSLMRIIVPRFILAYTTFFLSALIRGQFLPALRGFCHFLVLIPRKLRQRSLIQSKKMVADTYILRILVHDLPENSVKLRRLRNWWWQLRKRV